HHTVSLFSGRFSKNGHCQKTKEQINPQKNFQNKKDNSLSNFGFWHTAFGTGFFSKGKGNAKGTHRADESYEIKKASVLEAFLEASSGFEPLYKVLQTFA